MSHKQQQQELAPDEKMTDKVALRASQAGMRFIAQMTIYNSQKWERLEQFIGDSYFSEQLELQDIGSRLQVFKTTFERIGRLKVKQVLAANEHHVIVILETEKSADFFYVEVQVEDDYPHKITYYMHQPLQAMS